MRFVEVAPDRDEVHDREDGGGFVGGHLDGLEVGEEAAHGALAEGVGYVGADCGVDVAGEEELAEGAGVVGWGGVGGNFDGFQGWKGGGLAVGPGGFHLAFDPLDAGQVDAVFVLKHPALPHRSRHGVELDADLLAVHVGGFLDLVAVDGDEAVAEGARGEHGNGDEGAVSRAVACYVFRRGELAGVELLVLDHAVEDITRVVELEEIEVDAPRFDFAHGERDHAVVEPGCEGHAEGCHCAAGKG